MAPSDGPGPDPLEALKREIDARLRAGERPTPSEYAERLSGREVEVSDLVVLRTALFDEGLLDLRDEAPADQREDLLSRVEAEVQDALNRGERPDVVAHELAYPALAAEIERIAGRAEGLREVLTPEFETRDAGASPDDDDTGLGRYRLLERVAHHAIGPVYLGECRDPPERVELMVLRPTIPRETAWNILREADLGRELSGPGVLDVVEVGEARGVRFIAWRHVRGPSLESAVAALAFHGGDRTLEQLIPPEGVTVAGGGDCGRGAEAAGLLQVARVRLAAHAGHVAAALRTAAAVARILARAHRLGRPHYDVSPAAVVISARGEPVLRWFGLARHFRGLRAEDDQVPVYRAPEIVVGAPSALGWKADVYGVGALFHALVFLEAPLELRAGERLGSEALLRAAAQREERLARLPPSVAAVVRRLLDPDPEVRPGDCAALAAELEAEAAALLCGVPPAPKRSLFDRLRRRP